MPAGQLVLQRSQVAAGAPQAELAHERLAGSYRYAAAHAGRVAPRLPLSRGGLPRAAEPSTCGSNPAEPASLGRVL
jgi:hypothetical protein